MIFQALSSRRAPRAISSISSPTSGQVLILLALAHGPVRFNAIKRKVEGVSQKVLASTLKSLERNGLVKREAFATLPVTVEYSVTR